MPFIYTTYLLPEENVSPPTGESSLPPFAELNIALGEPSREFSALDLFANIALGDPSRDVFEETGYVDVNIMLGEPSRDVL